MALSLDDYKRIAADAHPDWDDAQKEQWAQSKVSWSQSDSNKEEEWRWGLLSWLADWWRKAWTSISWWFDDLISDETAQNSTIWKLWDMALNVVGWVLWWAVQSIAETPNFVWNLVSMPFTDKSEWWWSDVKDRARELQDEYWMNRAWAWLTAIDENNNSEHVWAQTIFQLLNNPLLWKWIWKWLDIVWWAIKWTGKTAQVVGKVANVADDAAKVSKWVKVAWAAEEVIEDTAKTAGKTSILSKIKNWYDKTKNYLKETTIWTKLKDAGVNTARFIWWPITDAYDILKVWVKTTRTAMKSSGVWSSLMQWLRATLWETVQTAGKFISKPLSYRTPRLWTTSTADMLLWDNIERWFAAGDKWDFRDEYWYSIDLVWYLNDNELQQYYDQNNIPQSKRLTADQIKEKQSQMWQNMFSDFTEGAKNLYEMFDIFSAPSFIMEQRRNNPWEVEVERNVRWEFRWFSNWKSINFETGEVKDADWKAINLEDLTADELKEVWLLYEQKQAEEMWEWTPYTWSQKTGIKSNNITNVINNYAVNWMLTDTAENLVMTSDNAWVRANAVYINNQLNEASKEYVNSIIANYTVDEINSNPQLQEELRRSLDAYSLLFNTTADYISRMDDKEYDDVYRLKKALRSAYNLLDDDSKDLIDNNLYRKSIDYNNNLESWFDKFWMKSATWVKRATDKMLNIFWTDDTNFWFEQWLSWLAWSLINPELASWWTAWWEISSWLRSNAAYAVDMVVLNKINDAVIEKFTGNMFDKAIRSNPKLYTKWFNWIKWWVTEMSSEFLENFTDAISMVEDPNTDYDFVTWFLFGMFQGAMAGYASSTDSYQSFKDYLTRPENRNAVLENMWIYIDAIEDPQQKAVMLSIVSQLMDDKSENNLIDIIANTASQTNNWVENLMQAYALYQVNKMVGDYTNSLVWQVLDEVNSVDEWTPELIQQYFWTESDPTWRKNFNNYNTWKQFVFNSAVINDIKNREENKKQAETIAKTSAAFIKSSFKTAWMSFEEWLNFMAPKINASNWKKVITPIKKTRTVERDIVDQTTWNPIKDTVSVFVKTWEIAFTIWDKLWITSKNDKLFWEKKSRFWLKTTKWFKNKIEVKTTNEDWTEKTETLTMKDYLVKQLNEANLTDEERQFIWTVLFKTTVSWLNPYFKDDWSLTKLWEDFLKQVMPQLEERTSTVDFFVNLASIQTLKEAQVEKSKNDAMKESGANDDPIPTLNIWWQAVEAWTNVSNLSDDTELLIEKDWKRATIRDLKNWGIVVNDNWRLATYRIKDDWTLDIIYDEEEDEQPFEEGVTEESEIERVRDLISSEIQKAWDFAWWITDEEAEARWIKWFNEEGRTLDELIRYAKEERWLDITSPLRQSQQQTGMPIQQEDWTILFAEDQRLDALSEEEFQKEYDQAEKDRKEAWRKYYAMEEEINKNPSRSDTARDQRFDTLVRLQREAYKATNKKKRIEESKKRRDAKNNNVQTQQQQKVEDPDNIKTYWSKYVLDNMYWQSQIKDNYWHKVKSVKLTISERNDVDKSQLTLPPEWVDFMDYQIDGWVHLIVDKQWNVYTVFDAWHFASEDFFETWIVKKWDEWVDNDIIDYLESINDRSLIEEWWILKVDYDYYIKHKKAILDWTEKPNWKKLNKNFVDFIESKRQSLDNDNTTPPPAAPAVQQESTEEEPNEAVQQVQERLNQVWTALPWATGEKVVQNTNPDTMKTTVPVSVYEHDHQDLQWKFVDVKTLLWKWDNLKSYIPYFVRNDQNVEKPINNRFEKFEYPDNLKHLTQSQLNTKYYQDQLPKVNIRQKDWTVKTYSLVFVWEWPITDIVWVTRKWMRRHNYFRSYALVDFKTERVNVSITSTIRPTWKWNEKLSKRPQALFYNNNRAITISKKDWSPMEWNRVLSFTRANDKQKNWTWWPDNWFISTTVQMERMWESDHDLAFKNKRVFMNAPSNDSDRKWFLYNFETHQVEQVKYDWRNIFTTSDIVFDDNNEIITIWDVDINIADRSYSNPIELKWKTNWLEEHTLQDWFNMLWDKWQTMKADWTTTDMTSNRKKISDVKKEFKEIVKTQNDNVEMVVEQAENTVTEPTESVEETILKNTESFKAWWTQESLFWWPSLDSVKTSVEDRINKIIDIAGREQAINNRIEDIKQDIEDLENEDNPDQEDIDSLNAEKNELVDQLETLSTFKKIVDESEDFDTIEQYLNSELDKLKEWDTNTIMDMASEYWILEWISNTTTPIVQEQISDQQQVQTPEWIKTIQTTEQEQSNKRDDWEPERSENLRFWFALSNNIHLYTWYTVHKDVLNNPLKYWKEWKIPAVRRSVDWNPNHSFWNPFDWWTKWEYWVAEATRRFYKWLKWTDYQDVNPEQRKWIIEQIKNQWARKYNYEWYTSAYVVYYTDDIPNTYKWNMVNDYWVEKYDQKHPNHAIVLQKFLNGEYTIIEPSTSTEAVMVSEWSVQSPNRYVTPQVPMLALPEPAWSRIISNNWLMLTKKEIESIQYGLDKYTRNATMPLPLNWTVALNDERTIFLHHWQFWLYLERQSNPNMRPERVSYVFSSEAWLANFVKSLTSAENILDTLDEEVMPEPSDLLAEEYPSNRVIWARLLTDKARLEQMVKDCEELWIVLWALDARALWQVILAYTKNWRWIDEVLEKFASDIPSSNVDEKLVDIMIKKWILSNAWTYDWLSLSQILAYNYWLKKIKKDQVKDIIWKTYITIWNWEKIYGLSYSKRKDLLNIITDYYIQNYLNLDPAAFWLYSKFRKKFRTKVEAKLLSSEIYVHKKWTHSALDDQEDVNMFLDLLHIKHELRKSFVEAAYTNQINAKPPRKPLITLSQYNYLMESDPFMTVIGNEEDYQVWPIWASVLDSINKITEIWEVTGENANRRKLQLLFDIYTYYQWSRKASYEWLVKFLRNKYRYSELNEDHTMKKLIDVIEEDSKLSWTPIHSEWVMMTLKSSNRESYEWDPYQNFIKNERWDNSIIDALIILESNDESSFQQIIEYAPKKIKDELYERFQEENRENKSSNIAYRMVSWLLLNNYKVINDLKQESQKDLPKAEWAVRDMLLWFNPMSLVNSAATRVLYNKFWLRWLDLNKWTVILTNNRQNSLWKWMPNFKNVERFPLLPVSSLNDIKADVNVIVPYWVSIPKDSNWYNYNIVRMENAWYHDWALVVWKIWNRVVDFGNRMYNIMWLYWLWVIQSDWFTISKEHKNIIKDNRTQKSLYWNIFKNNILPNLWEDFQNITEDDFYQSITSKAMKKVNLNMLYKCFAAWDMQELIDNSIAVINAVTNNEFELRSNNTEWRKTIDTYDAINQFSKFISKQSLSNKAKERIAKMFWDFLMIQMQIWKINIADRRTNFKIAHSQALEELYKLPDIKNAQVWWLELLQIFVNWNDTIKNEWKIKVNKKNGKTFYKTLGIEEDKTIENAIAEWRVIKWSPAKTIQQQIKDIDAKIDEVMKWKVITWKVLMSRLAERKDVLKRLKASNIKKSDKDSAIKSIESEIRYLESEIKKEKENKRVKAVEIDRRLLKSLYDQKKKLLKIIWVWTDSDNHNYSEQTPELDISTPNYIEYINEASWVEATQNLEEAQNSMILTDEAEDQNIIFSGKAMKVLEYLYNNYIKNNAVTVEPGQSQNTRNHVVSKDLMWMLIWENTFNNTYWDVTEWNRKVKRYAYSQNDLNQLVWILTSLKKTNAKRFKEVLDDIFRTYEDIWYTYDTPEHLDLIKYKSEVANNPANLYKIFSDLSNDKRFSIQFLEGWKVEKKLNYKDINMDWLLQSASKEYFEWSPYIVRTAEWVENMNKKVKEYHEKYDKYFDKLLPDWVKPSDEQIKWFAKLKFTFDKRKSKWSSSSKFKVFAIPGIAWAWKTTMLTAFFRYVNEVWWAQYEVDNIANWKQTSIIYQFSPEQHKAFNRAPKDKVFYAKIANKDKWWWDVYIKFTRWDMKTRDEILNMPPRWYTNEKDEYVEWVLDWYSNIWWEDAIPALTENWEWYEKKWLDKRDNQLKSWSYSVWKISNFKVVTDPKEVPANTITIRWNDWTLAPDASRYQDFPAIESNRALSDIHFAVRMHQTISSLKSTFSNEQKFNGIDYWTEASYMTQANSVNMDLFWYNDSPVVKKQMEWQFIIIDEAQNSYNSDLQAITEQLWWNNVVVMLWDFHQNSKWDFFKNLSEDGKYMVETHRWTEDINIMNEINAFTQNALIKANAVWFYMNDSDDFRRYDSVSPERYRGKPNEYLMVCRKNKTRKDLNAKYLESLWATIKYDKEWKIEDVSDIQPIIDSKAKLQVMVVDVLSDKKMNKRWRKSEMPNSWLDMEWFEKSELWNCYYKETDGSLQLFFPYTETSNYEWDIKDISKSDYIKKLAKWKDIEIFVPAFAITTEKESWKTVDNIILHDELVNIEYDSLSEQNVQTFYDAFTRWSKKVYIPQKAPRLIWITREDAKNLMEWKPLSKWYVEATSDKVSVDDFTMPVVTVRPEWWLDVLDDIDYLLWLWNFAWSELSEAVWILRNYNMWNQTFWDYEYQWERKSNDYIDVLKKRVADLWDQNRYWILSTLENQEVKGEDIEGTFNKIDAIIYWRVYKVPLVRDEKWEFQYWDWKEWQNDYRIWWNSKWQNKIVTLDDFKQYWMQIENWIATEWQVYRPQIMQDKWKLVMKMVPVNGRWVQRTTKWRIERRTKQEKEVIDIDAEKMEIERIFNFQFNNNVISEEWFRMQDYKPIAWDWININASLAKTPVELWTSNKKKWTIFEMNPNLTIDQKMNLVEPLKAALKNKVESYYSLLEENELYKPVEVPYKPFVVRKIWTSLKRFWINRIDPSIVDWSETFRTDNIDDAKVWAIINKIYERYKWARNKDYLQYDPDWPLPWLVKREDLFLKRSDVEDLIYTQPEYWNATPEQIEKIRYDESHTPTALQVDYESIMRQIDNIKVASAVDNERLNWLKANIESFMERVYDIENRENFAWYDNEEFWEWWAFSLNDEWLYSSCEDAENCGW